MAPSCDSNLSRLVLVAKLGSSLSLLYPMKKLRFVQCKRYVVRILLLGSLPCSLTLFLFNRLSKR